jgi:hypothetical protein
LCKKALETQFNFLFIKTTFFACIFPPIIQQITFKTPQHYAHKGYKSIIHAAWHSMAVWRYEENNMRKLFILIMGERKRRETTEKRERSIINEAGVILYNVELYGEKSQ